MTVASVTVRFLRRVQVADYEPAEAEMTFVASLAEVAAPLEYADALLERAKRSVLKALGKSAGTETAEVAVVSQPAQLIQPAALAQTAQPVQPAQPAQPAKRGPGRPKKNPIPNVVEPVEQAEPETDQAFEVTSEPVQEPKAEIDPFDFDVDEADSDDEAVVKKPASVDEFRREVYAIASALGPEGAEKIRKLRAEYGVAQVIQIPEAKWVEFLTRAKALAR